MKFIGSTSTESFIPVGNLYFGIIFAKELCIFMDFDPLIKNLILNFFFNLNNGAFTGPNIFPSILVSINFLKLKASFSNLFSLSPVKIKEINLWKGGSLFFFLISNSLSKKISGFLFVISEITSKNPDIFLDRELEIRKKNKLPPFQRFISLILTGDNEIKLEKEAINFKNFIENKIEGKILGPVNAPLFRLKRKFRIRFLIRGLKSMKLQSSLAKVIPQYKFSSGIKLSVDVDPINFN